VFRDTTPLVEGISIDEAFLDVAGLRKIAGPAPGIAARLRQDVAERVGLPITVGVARTKFLAKVASRVAKPDGLLVVPVDGEQAFLHPLPVGMLWGVGKVTTEKLHGLGVRRVAEVAELGEPALVSLLGPAAGHHLYALATGRDPRPVQVGRRRRSMGAQRALGNRPRAPGEVDAMLAGLVDRVMRRMRAAHRVGRTVVLRLRFGDFSRATRSHTLSRATARTDSVLEAARTLLVAAAPLIRDRGLTLIGISVGNLDDDGGMQLALPFAERRAATHGDDPEPEAARESALDSALDGVRDRFGSAAVTRGVLLRHGQGLEVPLLPD
jgi:DNA polymerase-4